jgi:hypothetical protein
MGFGVRRSEFGGANRRRTVGQPSGLFDFEEAKRDALLTHFQMKARFSRVASGTLVC